MIDKVTANAGQGGSSFAVDNDGTQLWPVTKQAFGSLHSAYVIVDDVNGQRLPVKVGDALPAGTNLIGNVKLVDTGGTNQLAISSGGAAKVDGSAVTQPVSMAPATSGGLSIGRLISAATTNATSLKASAGQVFSIAAYNLNASPRYLKLYNKASAPTVGTDTPVATLLIPGNTAGAGLNFEVSAGLAFATGIAYAVTGGMADNDTTAINATEVSLVIGYK